MTPKVRDLYKRILFAGREYPQGLDYVREKAKKEFFKNQSLTEEVKILKAIAYGRYMAREIVAISALHKYRTMKNRYRQEDWAMVLWWKEYFL